MSIDRSADVSAWMWRHVAPLISRKRDERADENLRIAFPMMGEAERRRIVAAHWESLGRVMAETIQIDRIVAEPDRFTFLDPEGIFAGNPGAMGPVVATSMHMGNWELVAWPLANMKARPAGVYRRVDNPYIDKYLRSKRVRIFSGGLWGRGKGSEAGERNRETAARKILSHLESGGIICMVADLYERRGVVVPFFGQPAPSFKGPGQLARSTGARVLVGRCTRQPQGSRFRIEVREVRYQQTENQALDIAEITKEIQTQFEAWIRETPDQWMWSNRRWS